MDHLPRAAQEVARSIYVTMQQRIVLRSRLRSGVCSPAEQRAAANHVLQLGAAIRTSSAYARSAGILPVGGLQLLQQFYDCNYVPADRVSAVNGMCQ